MHHGDGEEILAFVSRSGLTVLPVCHVMLWKSLNLSESHCVCSSRPIPSSNIFIFKGLRLTAGRRPSNDSWLMLWEDWAEILRENPGKTHGGLCWTEAGIMRSACLYGSSLGLCWAQVVPMLGQVGPMLSHLGPVLGLCWAKSGRCWAVGPILGLYWPRLGLCWAHLGPMLGLCHVGICWPYATRGGSAAEGTAPLTFGYHRKPPARTRPATRRIKGLLLLLPTPVKSNGRWNLETLEELSPREK